MAYFGVCNHVLFKSNRVMFSEDNRGIDWFLCWLLMLGQESIC